MFLSFCVLDNLCNKMCDFLVNNILYEERFQIVWFMRMWQVTYHEMFLIIMIRCGWKKGMVSEMFLFGM